jgi:hypothetical protein
MDFKTWAFQQPKVMGKDPDDGNQLEAGEGDFSALMRRRQFLHFSDAMRVIPFLDELTKPAKNRLVENPFYANSMDPEEDRRDYLVTVSVPLAFQAQYGEKKTFSVGTILETIFRYDMNATGKLQWLPAPDFFGNVIGFVPTQMAPAPPPAPTSGASWGDLANTSNGFDNGNFTNNDRAKLNAIFAAVLGVK